MTNNKRDSEPMAADLNESPLARISWLLGAFSWFLLVTGLLLPDAHHYLRICLLSAAIASFFLFFLCWYLHLSEVQIWNDYLMRRRKSAETLSDIESEFRHIRDFVSQQKEAQQRQEDFFREFLREFERDRASEHSEAFERASQRYGAKEAAAHHQPQSKYEEAMSALGLEHGFSQGDLKKAWIKKAFETHPDHGGSNEKFQKVTDAYNFLRA